MKRNIIWWVLALLMVQWSCKEKIHWEAGSEEYPLRLEMIADSIQVPFGMTVLPSGDLLVTDRAGDKMLRINADNGKKTVIRGVPKTWAKVDGGFLDVLLHPDFASNGWLYFAYAEMKPDSTGTLVIERAKLDADSLIGRQRLFTSLPYYKEPNHFGCRMVIQNGYLFFTMGERYHLRDSAQVLSNHLGKVMRIFEDGTIPPDNPFVGVRNAKPEIWSYGHRNAQGLVLHPETGELWEHEHGPKGGDEVNIIHKGLNYGWPVICYGINYDGTPVGDSITHHEGMEQPLYHYTPSIAPSGMIFYTGNKFPKWKGNLLIGAMALRHLNRLVIENGEVVHEERLLLDQKWRVRSLAQSPEGYIYIGVDGGMILRLMPG